MKRFTKIILAFAFTGLVIPNILIEFNQVAASLAWVFALVIGQFFGQLLAPFYPSKKQEISPAPKEPSIIRGFSLVIALLLLVVGLYAVLWFTHPAYMNCVNNYPSNSTLKSFFDAVQSCKP